MLLLAAGAFGWRVEDDAEEEKGARSIEGTSWPIGQLQQSGCDDVAAKGGRTYPRGNWHSLPTFDSRFVCGR